VVDQVVEVKVVKTQLDLDQQLTFVIKEELQILVVEVVEIQLQLVHK
jgi:hypothetical protein